MNVTGLLYGIGSVGPFASRVFLPALLTALLLRFGGHIYGIEHLGLLAKVHGAPTWFTSNASLIVLAILSGAEIAGQKSPEVRHVLHEFDVYLKAGAAVLSSFGVISSTDAGFIQAVSHAGIANYAGPLIAGLGVLRIAPLRRQVMSALFDHVEGTHLDHLVSWLEDLGALAGILLLVLFPVLMIVLLVIATAMLWLVRRRFQIAEDRRQVACGRCAQSVYPCAVRCGRCSEPVAEPLEIGFLGHSLPDTVADVARQPYRLFEKRRCAVCASRLVARDPFRPCAVCSNNALMHPQFVEAYVGHVGRRVGLVLAVCFLFSLVPIIGLIAGVIFYRIELVLPFAQYLPPGRRFLLRWGIRILFFALVIFQIVPILGGLVVPIMALVSFGAYRASFLSVVETRAVREETGSVGATPHPA